ncbi:MAG: porphobilinogen synthase [Candidatus Omnitrophica bacterium]|nr:porphobilinogen synthase [Candidatus Omnitrophota bacterium]MBU2062843.1 porphobilinogen synthase [Candidatus Omnitrophota bacterium]
MHYPIHRLRRLRQNNNFRRLVRESSLSADNLIMPFFLREGENIKNPISSMPGQFQLSVDHLIKEVKEARDLGIPAVLLFDIPSKKDDSARGAYAKDGLMQKAVSALKKRVSDILVITNVCLCEHTRHGHCGIIRNLSKGETSTAFIDNDLTVDILAKVALSHAEAGADMVAPSGMMDGQVGAIRKVLDGARFMDTAIMAYSAKYASGLYGPFRQAAQSAPQSGDRSSYQMDIANSNEALREVELDIQEGADIVMVKPALTSLDIIYRVKQKFNIPLAAYNVSGEYSLVKAAAQCGWVDESKIIWEILRVIKRAGADIIITYYAKEIAAQLNRK